jgi:hypothetical protein
VAEDLPEFLAPHSSTISSLTIIDSEIVGLHKLLNVVGPKRLKQLIVIFNRDLDLDYDHILSTDNSFLQELLLTDFGQFQKLQYFEYSIYNDA